MKLLQAYKNGNTKITLFDDGTRIMECPDNETFNLDWPASIDLNISNYCTKGCSFCYQGCTKEGMNADLERIQSLLHPYMEIAININVGYEFTDEFISFLTYCRDNHIVVNATMNQDDTRRGEVAKLQSEGLLKGIGISMTKKERVEGLNDVVWHVIAGIVAVDELDWLMDNKHNVLILGYKQKGRAANDELPNMDYLKGWVSNRLQTESDNVISFDNKAIEQLDVKSMIDPASWDMFYQGDEGTVSFYIDGVNMTFSENSFTNDKYNVTKLWQGEGITEHVIQEVGDMNVGEMFKIIKEEKNEKIYCSHI